MAALIPPTTPQKASGTELDLPTTGSPSRQTTEMPPRMRKVLSSTTNIAPAQSDGCGTPPEATGSGAGQNQRSWPRMQRTALRSAQHLTRPLGRNIVMFSVSKAGPTLLTRVAMRDRQKLRCTISADAQVLDIDRDYRVRQRSGSNATNAWTDGSINDKNLESYRGDLIGLHACPASPNADMRLWYASNETTFEEYTFGNDDDDEWTWQRSWTGYSAAAGVGCYSWGPDNYTYAAFVNLDNALELWYNEKTDEDPAGWRQSMFQPDGEGEETTGWRRRRGLAREVGG